MNGRAIQFFQALAMLAAMTLTPAYAAADPVDPDDAFRQLSAGNVRYITGKPEHPHLDHNRRIETAAAGQKPIATVIAAADARVPVELIFDQGVGDLYVIRVAGIVPDSSMLASVDYAINHLKSPLLVVMGHSDCDVVEAAVEGTRPAGRFGKLVERVGPVVDRAKQAFPQAKGDDLLDKCIKANVQNTIETVLTEVAGVQKLAQEGKLKILGAFYDLDSGRVAWLPGPGRADATTPETDRPNLPLKPLAIRQGTTGKQSPRPTSEPKKS